MPESSSENNLFSCLDLARGQSPCLGFSRVKTMPSLWRERNDAFALLGVAVARKDIFRKIRGLHTRVNFVFSNPTRYKVTQS